MNHWIVVDDQPESYTSRIISNCKDCTAFGWNPDEHPETNPTLGQRWAVARSRDMKLGDLVTEYLRNWQIGRTGEFVRAAVSDAEWDPTVPVVMNSDNSYAKDGNGRRIYVNWSESPPDKVAVVPLALRKTFNPPLQTVMLLKPDQSDLVKAVTADATNWQPLVIVKSSVYRPAGVKAPKEPDAEINPQDLDQVRNGIVYACGDMRFILLGRASLHLQHYVVLQAHLDRSIELGEFTRDALQDAGEKDEDSDSQKEKSTSAKNILRQSVEGCEGWRIEKKGQGGRIPVRWNLSCPNRIYPDAAYGFAEGTTSLCWEIEALSAYQRKVLPGKFLGWEHGQTSGGILSMAYTSRSASAASPDFESVRKDAAKFFTQENVEGVLTNPGLPDGALLIGYAVGACHEWHNNQAILALAAGNPSKEDLILVYGKAGAKLSYENREAQLEPKASDLQRVLTEKKAVLAQASVTQSDEIAAEVVA